MLELNEHGAAYQRNYLVFKKKSHLIEIHRETRFAKAEMMQVRPRCYWSGRDVAAPTGQKVAVCFSSENVAFVASKPSQKGALLPLDRSQTYQRNYLLFKQKRREKIIATGNIWSCEPVGQIVAGNRQHFVLPHILLKYVEKSNE